jgi:Fe-S cluster assembly protein SufB
MSEDVKDNDQLLIEELAQSDYKYGFVTDIEQEYAPKGLNEDIIRFISAKKNEPEFMLNWRLKAYRHWLTMKDPSWAKVDFPKIDYQDSYYYAAPKKKLLKLMKNSEYHFLSKKDYKELQ